MKPLSFREMLLAILFGLGAPYLWTTLLGLSAVYFEMPMTHAMIREFGTSAKSHFNWITFGMDAMSALMIAILIATPFGFVLRNNRLRYWLLFLVFFIGELFVSAMLGRGLEGFSYIIGYSSLWLFLIASGIFIWFGGWLRGAYLVANPLLNTDARQEPPRAG
jgi:hypothetical protein